MQIEFDLRARRSDAFFGEIINLYAFWKHEGRRQSAANPLVFCPVEEGEIIHPFAEIDKRVAQILIDDLWEAGLRPSEGTGSAGALAATQKHLDDLRTVAFHALKINEVRKV